MHQAWFKSVILHVTLWSHPYVKEGDFLASTSERLRINRRGGATAVKGKLKVEAQEPTEGFRYRAGNTEISSQCGE
ncbi:MAG: hypothetical protein KY475_01335 [Planctomycetes bacterium]|nr:hypothetical protein [Planctomycetota bacterium]